MRGEGRERGACGCLILLFVVFGYCSALGFIPRPLSRAEYADGSVTVGIWSRSHHVERCSDVTYRRSYP